MTTERTKGSNDMVERLVIRVVTKTSELEELARIANEEEWNEAIADHEIYLKCDPEGIFVALLDDEPVGFTCSVIWSDQHAVGGLSIVKKEYRGQGIGKTLWAERRKHVGNRGLQIFSVLDRIEANKKFGFKEYDSLRFISGKVNKASLITTSMNGRNKIVPYDESLLDRVVAYDNLIHHISPRKMFLRLWFGKDKSTTMVGMEEDKVVGYGCIYPTYEGYRLAPLYADSRDIATNLLRSLLDAVPESEPMITMSVFLDNAGIKLAEELNLSMGALNVTAMCTKEIEFRTEKVYAVTSIDLTFV